MRGIAPDWTPYYLSGARFGDRAKRLRGMSPATLRMMVRDRQKLIAFLNREIRVVAREVARQRPRRIAYYWFDGVRDGTGCGRFALARPDGSRRRDAHPLKPSTRGGQYPMPHSADLAAWFEGNAVTHVIAETSDDATSPECIACGKHTVAAFLAWWRRLEQDDDE